jgi:hypothetical protein
MTVLSIIIRKEKNILPCFYSDKFVLAIRKYNVAADRGEQRKNERFMKIVT